MTRRAPPGPQLSTGRIRVDAAKALAKLRAYRLTDPMAWILEAIRAAIASGATRLALDGDADDVWLRWSGPPWPADELPRLFDELVSPEQGRDAYHRRLLASAINSALGLEPAWVDVIVVDGAAAARVRFTPAIVIPDDDDLAPRRELAVDIVTAPPGFAGPGMIVHLHCAPSLGVLAQFLRGADPPELVLARTACADVAVPMTIAGAPIGRAHGDDLLREPLGEGLDGFVALVDPDAPRPQHHVAGFDVAELGVRIASDPWFPRVLTGFEVDTRPPLRLFVDAPRMPTNASRSQVRHDAHPIDAALRRADVALPAVVTQLIEAIHAGPEPARAARLRAAALALLAVARSGRDWTDAMCALTPPLVWLADLPILRNAVGHWRPVAATWRRAVFRGNAPLAMELAPWLDTLAWSPPGDPSAALFGPSDDAEAAAVDNVIADARRRRLRHAAFLERPVQQARVAPRAESRIRARLGAGPSGCVPAHVLEGLSGEVCVAPGPGPGRVTLLFEGRPLETAPLDVALAIDAVIACDALTPDALYRRAEDDDARRRALTAARAGAIRAIEALCDDDAHPGVTIAPPRRLRDDDAPLVRAALGLAHRAAYAIDDDTPLAAAAVWPTAGGARVSLAELRRATAVGVASPGAAVVAPAGRPIVLGEPADHALLTALLAPAAVVPYDGAHARPSLDPAQALARHVLELTGAATLVVRADTHGGAIAFAVHSQLALAHRGIVLAEVARTPALVACAIAIDSDAIVPTPDWRGLHDDAGVAASDLAGWERALVVAAAHALLGDPTPDLHVPQRPVRLDDATGRGLCAAIAAGGLEVLDAGLVPRLRAHPMLRALGRARPISVDELCRDFPRGAIPVLRPDAIDPPGLAFDGWSPLVADHAVAGLVERLAGRTTIDAAVDLARRCAAAMQALRLAAHRAKPVAAIALPAACLPMPIGGGLRGVIGCAPALGTQLEIDIAFEGRWCTRIVSSPDLPAVAVIEVDLDDLDDDLTLLHAETQAQVLLAVRRGVARWLAAIAGAQPTALADHPPARALLAAWLARTSAAADKTRGETIELLRHAAAWPIIQGGHGATAAAAHGAIIAVATWSGTWLPGPPAHALDAPVIALPLGPAADEMRAIIDALGPWLTEDVTDGVLRLQQQRRVARGIIPAPSVPGADPTWTRRLDQLDARHDLGAGVIALVDAPASTLLLHADGELQVRLAVDVAPSIQLAIEAPELIAALAAPDGLDGARRVALQAQAQALATTLLAALIADGASDQAAAPAHLGARPSLREDVPAAVWPAWLCNRVRRALLAGRVDPAAVADAPIFDTTAGRRVSWSAVLAQQARYGDVWAVTADPPGPPLDEHRLVLRLHDVDTELGAQLDAITLVGAARQLALDAKARANQTRAAVATLAVPAAARAGALAVIALPAGPRGDRGIVMPLHPTEASHRGVLAHRAMVPFDRVADPCPWPTLAVVEDPSLTPDRTWSAPLRDDAWQALVERIQRAGADAVEEIAPAPGRARASAAITAWSNDGAPPPRAVIGALWLEPDDTIAGTVTVSTPAGDVELDAPDDLPIGGRLFVYPDPPGLPSAVAALCRRWHPVLLERAHGSRLSTPTSVPSASPFTPVVETSAPSSAPPAASTPSPSSPLAPAAVPPHPLRALALALHTRLQTLGDAGWVVARVDLAAGRRAPLVAIVGDAIALAGDAPLLHDLAAALANRALRADGGLDALAAHAIAVAHEPFPTGAVAAQLLALDHLLR